MEEYQQRALGERNQLDERMKRLVVFCSTPTYKQLTQQEKSLLIMQLEAMKRYLFALEQRISLFKKEG